MCLSVRPIRQIIEIPLRQWQKNTLGCVNMYCISQKAWTLFWKMFFAPAYTSHSYGLLGNLVD